MDLKNVLNSMQESYIIITDLECHVMFLNKKADRYRFLKSPIYEGDSLFDCVPMEKLGSFQLMIKNLVNSGLPFSTYVEEIEGGVKVHYEIKYSLVYDEFHRANSILIEARDVTGQKMFSNNIKRVTSDFNNLIENANAVIIGTDSRGYITDWNEKTEEVTGYSRNESFTQQLTDLLIDTETLPVFVAHWNSLLSGKQVSNYEILIHCKNGVERTLLLNGTPRKTVQGSVDGVLFVGQDISELISYRKSIEAKVKERTKMLQESNNEVLRKDEILRKEKKRSDDLLLNILPEHVAHELKDKGYVIPKHYSAVTILFADLVGFTSFCKGLSPEEIVYELNYIFVGFDMILERFGVEKIKAIGDGYMAVGGLEDSKTHALQTVAAGLEMIEFIDRLSKENIKSEKPPWRVRIGIHTGELVAGVIGKSKIAYDLWGASVNTASRMESSGEPGRVNISSATFKLVKDQFNCVYRGTMEVKNMGAVEMYFTSKI